MVEGLSGSLIQFRSCRNSALWKPGINIKPLLKVKFACTSIPADATYVQVKRFIHSALGLLLATGMSWEPS